MLDRCRARESAVGGTDRVGSKGQEDAGKRRLTALDVLASANSLPHSLSLVGSQHNGRYESAKRYQTCQGDTSKLSSAARVVQMAGDPLDHVE